MLFRSEGTFYPQFFPTLFCYEWAHAWCGRGLVGVAGAPRAVPCGALPRRVRPRTPARLIHHDQL
jgi:hypothetical protein